MGFFSIIGTIIVGFIVGLIARAIVPGVDALGFWLTDRLGHSGIGRRRRRRGTHLEVAGWKISSGRLGSVGDRRCGAAVGIQPVRTLDPQP